MSVIDTLLKADAGKLKAPTKDIKMDRLSKNFNSDIIFKCKAINGEIYSDIQKMSINLSKKGQIKDINMFDMQVMTVIEGVIDPNFKDKQLLDHFGAATPKELIKKILLAGEITDLFNVINKLSGYEVNEDEIKNS